MRPYQTGWSMFKTAASSKQEAPARNGMIAGFRRTLVSALNSLAGAIDPAPPVLRSSSPEQTRRDGGAHPVQLQSPALARWSRERNDAEAFNRRLQQVFVEAAMPRSAITEVPARGRRGNQAAA